MDTTLHYYRFDMSSQKQREEYGDMLAMLGRRTKHITDFAGYYDRDKTKHAFTEKLRGLVGLKVGDNLTGLHKAQITLDTTCLFGDQWNTTCGLRVMEWSENEYPNADIKEGYWLVRTHEMRTVLAKTGKCGYCGTLYPGQTSGLCDACIGSDYLKESDLHLTRIQPVSSKAKRKPLSAECIGERMALRAEKRAAIIGQRREALRQKIIDKCIAAIDHAHTERDGMLWVLDRMPALYDNAIYYSHTDTFGFGWRTPLTADERAQIIDSGFPFNYKVT